MFPAPDCLHGANILSVTVLAVMTLRGNDMSKSAFQMSAREYGKSANKTWAMFVRTIADGVVEGHAVFDPNAADGKGQWKKGAWSNLLKALLAEAGKTEADGLPYVNGKTASTTGECMRRFHPEILQEQDVTKRHELCDAFAERYSSNACAEMVKPKKDPMRELLAKIVSDCFARATSDINGYSVEQVVEEVIAQAESLMDGDA